MVVLLLGMTALLSVAYNRHQRHEDAITDLRRNLNQQESKIVELQERLQDCDTIQTVAPPDTSWSDTPPVNSEKGVASQATPPKW